MRALVLLLATTLMSGASVGFARDEVDVIASAPDLDALTARLAALTRGADKIGDALSRRADSGRVVRVDCNARRRNTIAAAIARARDGDTLLVRGDCVETLTIDKDVTIDGQGRATLSPEDPADATVLVVGARVAIVGLELSAPAFVQVISFDGASVQLRSVTARNATFGVVASERATLTALDSTIADNTTGALAIEGGALRLGVEQRADATARPNQIATNTNGVATSLGGTALVVGNLITGNNVGVAAVNGGSAQVTANTIAGNNVGVFVNTNASILLSDPAAVSALLATPNAGVNTTLAIGCQGGSITGQIGGFVPAIRLAAPQGALGGVPNPAAPFTFCQDSTIP